MKSIPFQRMAGDMGVSACVPGVRAPLFTGFLLLNMCFRGSFSGGASAKDKGHRGHRERFFCSSGFQIIQGRREGASRPSFSPFSPSLIEFPSLDRHVPSAQTKSHIPASARRYRPEAAPSGAAAFQGPEHKRGCHSRPQPRSVFPPSTDASTGRCND